MSEDGNESVSTISGYGVGPDVDPGNPGGKPPAPDPMTFGEFIGLMDTIAKSRPMDKTERYRIFRQHLMNDETGRKVLFEILAEAGIFRSGFEGAGVPIDVNAVIKNNGKRDMALWLIEVICAPPKERRQVNQVHPSKRRTRS